MQHFYPCFAGGDCSGGYRSLCGIHVRFGTKRCGAAVAARPVWAAQARIRQSGERTENDQIKGEKQREYC